MARRFNKTFRYIDDLLRLNNSQFEKSIPNIYPKELEFKKTTESPKHFSYLDLNITISGLRFTTDLWDKREAFKFRIVNFPHMDSNIRNVKYKSLVQAFCMRTVRRCYARQEPFQ